MKILKTEVKQIYNTVKDKPLTDKLTAYIIKAVLQPALEYRTQGIYLHKPQTEKIDEGIKKILRPKTNISRTTGAKTIHHPDFYNIPRMADLQFIARMTELLIDLNSPGLEGNVTRARMSQFQ